MATLIDATYLQGCVTPDVYLRLFDRAGTGVADSTYVAACIARADSKVRMRVFAYLGALDAAGGTVDEAIKGACAQYAMLEAVVFNPMFGGKDDQAPFIAGAKLADDFFDRLARDDRNRVVTSAAGRARPVASVSNAQTADGTYTNPFSRAADGKDPSGY